MVASEPGVGMKFNPNSKLKLKLEGLFWVARRSSCSSSVFNLASQEGFADLILTRSCSHVVAVSLRWSDTRLTYRIYISQAAVTTVNPGQIWYVICLSSVTVWYDTYPVSRTVYSWYPFHLSYCLSLSCEVGDTFLGSEHFTVNADTEGKQFPCKVYDFVLVWKNLSGQVR